MANLLLIVFCLLTGVIGRRCQRVPTSAPTVLSRVVVDLALPALTLSTVHGMTTDHLRAESLLSPVLAPWIALMATALVVRAVCRSLGWSQETATCLVLSAGFANTSFVGFPLVEALYGEAGLKVAVLVDISTFLMLASMTPLVMSAGRTNPLAIARRILAFPPFIALVVAVLLRPVPFPPLVQTVVSRLGALVVPLSLLAVGLQLRIAPATLRANAGPLALGLGLRLVAIPALTAGALHLFARGSGLGANVTIVELGMAPMITSSLMAIEGGVAPDLATLMIGVGVPLSLATVPIWAWVLGS